MKSNLLCLFTLCAVTACASNDGAGNENISEVNEAAHYFTDWSGYWGGTIVDAAVVSRGTNLYDVFTIQGNDLIYDRYASGWQPPGPNHNLGRPNGVSSLRSVAATTTLTATDQRLDVFVVGSDNHIWHRFTTGGGTGEPTWDESPRWHEIVGAPTVRSSVPAVAATSWGQGRIDLFWWTQAGNLGHAWAENLAWGGSESGDTAGKTYLQPPGGTGDGGDLSAVSWGSNRLDIFYLSGSFAGQLSHHWFDGAGNGWGSANREEMIAIVSGKVLTATTSLSVASAGANQLEIFVRGKSDGVPDIFRTTFAFGSWATAPGPANPISLSFDTVDHPATATPQDIFAALRSSNGSRVDLYGAGYWQAYRQN